MESDIRDIKGLVPMPLEGWVWLLLAFVVVAGALIFWVIRRQRKATVAGEPAGPALLPVEMALNALQQLRQESLPVEVFYTQLSDIVRRFIGDQFGLGARKRRQGIFLRKQRRRRRVGSLGAFLRAAHLVKFT